MLAKELLQLNRDPGTEMLQLVGEEFLPRGARGIAPACWPQLCRGKLRKSPQQIPGRINTKENRS